ncbi:DUF4329 domain-containing protein [Roseobacter sp. CCS2]|uniref:DUF4329 domain-containing protein n=1 Tax=Roseobacter sp. CCS2 TaxID=391593 RepID=UPI0002D902AB|nr:DUF4329 domain-containing protein [Roseobacter sp. CCS2]
MTYLKIGTVVAAVGLVTLVSCTEDPPIIAQTDDIDVFATSLLNGLQPVSIAESREYCGYIFETETGGLAATAPSSGREDFCDLPPPDDNVVASYHTHGSYSDVYDNEVPSLDDVKGDFDAEIDGYISTPAGRVWLVDFDAQIARQLCNEMCVTSDPNDDPDNSGFVPQSFTLEELAARFE